MGQAHAVGLNLGHQCPPESIAGKGVQIGGADALAADGPAQVVDRAPETGLEGAIRTRNQIDQGFTSNRHLGGRKIGHGHQRRGGAS